MAAGPFSNDFDEAAYLAADREHVPPLAEIVFQALGHVSLCWDPRPTERVRLGGSSKSRRRTVADPESQRS